MADAIDTAVTANTYLAPVAIEQVSGLAETSEAYNQTTALPLPDENPEELSVVADESTPQDKRNPIRILSFRGF